jgi:hypothetical protein
VFPSISVLDPLASVNAPTSLGSPLAPLLMTSYNGLLFFFKLSNSSLIRISNSASKLNSSPASIRLTRTSFFFNILSGTIKSLISKLLGNIDANL